MLAGVRHMSLAVVYAVAHEVFYVYVAGHGVEYVLLRELWRTSLYDNYVSLVYLAATRLARGPSVRGWHMAPLL
jgi:hypothetical protein